MSPLLYQLQAYKNYDNFPTSGWEKRGLNPSEATIRQGMNLAVTDFADFLIDKIYIGITEPAELQAEI